MKKLLFYSAFLWTSYSQAQTSASEITGQPNNAQLLNQTKTYTSCGYLQEGNSLENGRISQTSWPLVCADDFVIPDGECWSINNVITPFMTSAYTSSDNIIITFYNDAAGAPGAIAGSYTATSADFVATNIGSAFGLIVYSIDINLGTSIDLCGGPGGTTYWFSAQVDNFGGGNYYWEFTTLPTYGGNSLTAPNSSGPWNSSGPDNFVFTINYGQANNLTLTECEGFSITVGANTYTSSIVVSETFTSVLTGCDSIVNLDLTILPPATGTDVQTACESFLWIDGNTYTSDNSTATHTIVGGAVSGCDSIVTLNLDINGPANGVTQTGVNLEADDVTATYQWLDCNGAFAIVPGATSQTFTAPAPGGDYAVEVTANGCVDTSACFEISYVGLSETENGLIALYPNPANDLINLQGLQNLNEVSLITIHSISGEVVAVISKPVQQIGITELAAGIYTLTITHAEGIETIRFVKK